MSEIKNLLSNLSTYRTTFNTLVEDFEEKYKVKLSLYYEENYNECTQEFFSPHWRRDVMSGCYNRSSGPMDKNFLDTLVEQFPKMYLYTDSLETFEDTDENKEALLSFLKDKIVPLCYEVLEALGDLRSYISVEKVLWIEDEFYESSNC